MLTNIQKARSAREAANLIRTEGWMKSEEKYVPGEVGRILRFPKTGDTKKCFCPVTAIPPRGYFEVIDSFARFLGYRGPHKESDLFVIHWNDSQHSPEPVIEALESFATYIENEKELEIV